MARALLLALVLLTFGTVYLFVSKIWWMPGLASSSGLAVDHEFSATLLVLGAVFILAQLALGIFLWKFRNPASLTYSTGHRDTEVAWTAITAVVFIALSLAGERTWAELRTPSHVTEQD